MDKILNYKKINKNIFVVITILLLLSACSGINKKSGTEEIIEEQTIVATISEEAQGNVIPPESPAYVKWLRSLFK